MTTDETSPPPQLLVWKPNPGRQFDFLKTVADAKYYEILYGGARGGGKTDAGIMSLLYYKDHPLYRALVIRKNSDDLKDWGDRAERWYTSQGATRIGNPPEFSFSKGGKIRTGHLKDENAYTKYQGHEYHRILVEELTQIPSEENYLKLASSCRSTIPSLRPAIISTCNPDGPGFYWVRKRFNIEGIPTEPIVTTDSVTNLKRIFIPARLSDNPFLSKDPSYKSFLDGLPDGLREAWRDGSWNDPLIKGAYYTDLIAQARKEGRIKLVPHDTLLKVHTVWDLGMDDSMVIGFFQRKKNDIRLINYYENSNEGLAHYIAKLQTIQMQNKYSYGRHFAPHDANRRELTTGLTIIQTAGQMGLNFEKVPSVSIQDGIERVRNMFPRLSINEPLCEQALAAFSNYRKVYDDNLLKYDDTPIHDWSSHACFTGDTKVLTSNGMYPIMELRDNSLILTKKGWRLMKKIGITKRNARLVEILFKDNTRVRCTEEHLFLTNKGWISAKSLQKGFKIQSSLTLAYSISMVSYIVFFQMRNIFQAAVADYIEWFGKMSLEKFLKDITFTIKTVIRWIIELKILNVKINMNTYLLNGREGIKIKKYYLLKEQETSQQNGTHQKREDYGIVGWPVEQKVGLNGNEKKENVCFVKKNIQAWLEIMGILKNFVIQIVKPLTIESVKELDYKEDVWDINVPSEGHFSLSNGAIVQNCDMLRYAALSEENMTNTGMIIPGQKEFQQMIRNKHKGRSKERQRLFIK